MQILRPAANIFAFYEGRPDATGAAGCEPTWVEQGALSLGIASFAIFDGSEALVYDTHVSVDRAAVIRETLEQQGVTKFTVLLSHWHLNHIAGTEAFPDCEIIAGKRTLELLTDHRQAIEAGTYEGPPAIKPLVLPTTVISERTRLKLGKTPVDLIPTQIHSEDATLVWLPEQRLLLVGDTLEDTVTYYPPFEDVHQENLKLVLGETTLWLS